MSLPKNKLMVMMIFLLAAGLVNGCGGDSKKESSEEDFRVPDSLLAPMEGYGILVDEYHPVRGGVIANKDIALHYPPSNIAKFISTNNFGYAYEADQEVVKHIGRPADGQVVIIGAKDLAEYKYLTKKDWWHCGVIQGDTLYFMPFNIMMQRYDIFTRRSLAQIGLTQKLAQMALNRKSDGKIPTWLREGIASFVANEKPILQMQAIEFETEMLGFNPEVEELDRHLDMVEDRAFVRVSSYIAYTMFERLMESFTLKEILSFVGKLGEEKSLDQASGEVFGMDYVSMIEKIKLEDDFTVYLKDVPRGRPGEDR
ncbi:MAG: hypothetical protein KAV42_08600 [Candidatus Krumholzibacteria bacterium]|nr:hypothetical protein [Candidatus Krumholzibacteria bacterium]